MTKPPRTCRPDQTLGEAAQMMWDDDCGCLPVTAGDGSGRLIGMITDRDICPAARTLASTLSVLRVGHVMTEVVRACNPEDPITEALEIMREAGVRRLPVVTDSERVVGVISLTDLARLAVRDRGSQNAAVTEGAIADLVATMREPAENGRAAQSA